MNNIWRRYHDGALIPWKPPHLDLGISKEQIRSDIAKNNAIASASKEAGKRIVALINSKGLN